MHTLHHDHRPTPRLRAVLLVLALLAAGVAAAQDARTGTVTATFDGEERTWATMLFAGEETGTSTATWGDVMGMFTTLHIQAHPEERYAVQGTLSIDATAYEAMPLACPCTFPDASIMLWTESTIMEDVYMTDAATLVVERLEEVADGVYEIEGTFEGSLSFRESVMDGPGGADEDDTVAIQGSFVIDRLERAATAEDAPQ